MSNRKPEPIVPVSKYFGVSNEFCREQASDRRLRNWQRLAFHAFGNLRSGACETSATELSMALKIEVTALYKDLALAVDRGWLAEGSTLKCLLAPRSVIPDVAWLEVDPADLEAADKIDGRSESLAVEMLAA